MNSFSQPAVWSGPVMQRQRVKAGTKPYRPKTGVETAEQIGVSEFSG